MSFWKNSGYSYAEIVDLPTEKLLLLLNSMTRGDMIEWLSWNDRNGIYEDKQSLKELGNIMARDEALEIIIRQIEERRAPAK